MKFFEKLSVLRAIRSAIMLGLFFVVATGEARAQQADSATEQAGSDTKEAGSDTKDEEKKMRPTLDLGMFKIKDLRPTRNETAKITFKMHLALSEKLSERQVEYLMQWKQRIRNQVIVAVRTLHTKDFQEADLSLLRRKVLIRVNRLFKAKVAEEALLTEYVFRTH